MLQETHFGVSSVAGLKHTPGDDIWPIEVPFDGLPANIDVIFAAIRGDKI